MIEELVLSIALTWLLVKIIKTIVDCKKEKKFSLRILFYDGGMPSAHTASVVSLATALFLETGFSALFVIGVIFALIVINDALKVRMITQEQSRIINKLTEGKKDYKRLDERVGHKPLEVLVSLVLGIIIPIIIYAVI